MSTPVIARKHKLFVFDPPVATPLGKKWLPRVAPAVERIFGLDALNEVYRRCTRPGEEGSFLDRVLEDLAVSYHLAADDLARIPKTGPVMVVANHPFGALDGMILAALLRHVRPDAKVMANYLLGRIPDIRDMFILVDPFQTEKSARENIRPLREAIRWVQNGGLLAVFPAGEVAHADLRTRHVEEPLWSPTIARIARKAGAPVLPMYFHGRNSNAFQLMGLLNARFRTALLARELLKKRGEQIELRVGSIIPNRKIVALGEDIEVANFLRHRTLLLRHRGSANKALARPPMVEKMAPIVPAVPARLLAAEIDQLPADQLLCNGGDMLVYEARARQIPNVLREIGRLRETTYRPTGEGTGKSLDLDRYDEWYHQMFIWNREKQEIVGAYRLGPTEEILPAHGKRGLYTSTLFKFRPGLIERLGPAIEMGRSWIRVEYQKSYNPLLLLWKGIGQYVLKRPTWKTLFGPVSISNEYQTASKHVMVRFLSAAHHAPDLKLLTRARHPFRPAGVGRLAKAQGLQALLGQCESVDDMVADLEPDGKGMPVLLRQYLKLGARFFAFNVDPEFCDALDALMIVDLTKTDQKVLNRYMTAPGAARFRKFHGVPEAPGRKITTAATDDE